MEPSENTINDCDYVRSNQGTTNDCDLDVKSSQDANNEVVLNTYSNQDTDNECVLNENLNQNTNNGISQFLGPQNDASERTLGVPVSLSTFDTVPPDLLTDNVCPDKDKHTPLCESNTENISEHSANSPINPELLNHITSLCDDENGVDDEDDEDDEEYFSSSDTSKEEDIASVASEPAELQGSPSFYIYLLAAFKPENLEQHLSRGGDVNAADSFGVTPLMYAEKYNDSIVTKILTKLGAKFPKESKETEKIVIDESFMFRQICGAARSIEEPSLVVLVCQVLGCPVDMRNEAGETALVAAVRESNINAVQNLLTAGARIDDRIFQACNDQSIYEILIRKINETTTRDVGCENRGSSVEPICPMFSLPLLSYTVSTACVNEANQDLLSNRTDSNNVDNNQTENAFEVVTYNIQKQDSCSLTQTRDTSEITNIQHVSLDSPPETRSVENISQKSSSETGHVENVSHGSQKETGNVQILSQDEAWEINAESESQPGDIYNTNFGDRLEAPAFLKFHNSDGDSTAELSSTSSSQSNIEPETSTLSASSGVDNSYLNHSATESKSENTNIQTADEKCLGSMQTSSQEQMTSDNKVYETPTLQTQNENMGAGPKEMPTPRNESESGFFSMQK
ncbi:hypothetical protein Bpfe_003209 [Biomphalaria pfeifferi]|uniref:ANK_REP_REGION domain-containing protein n=1 Tax=Biomphalaria pfeifferi TaxID=112525 RepID=A0AAD8C658_BIOPF|nr:hypothetical protein Bpfe_003209 [Biomphalaria pfeifferi]